MMVCNPKASAEVVHVAIAVPAVLPMASACVAQPEITELVPPVVAVKLTVPVSGTPPEG